VAKAAIRPGQTVRKAIDGAAVGDRLKAYNETMRALPAASSPEKFASYPLKRDFLRNWARPPVVAAQVIPTGFLIDSYANAAAHGMLPCVHPARRGPWHQPAIRTGGPLAVTARSGWGLAAGAW